MHRRSSEAKTPNEDPTLTGIASGDRGHWFGPLKVSLEGKERKQCSTSSIHTTSFKLIGGNYLRELYTQKGNITWVYCEVH